MRTYFDFEHTLKIFSVRVRRLTLTWCILCLIVALWNISFGVLNYLSGKQYIEELGFGFVCLYFALIQILPWFMAKPTHSKLVIIFSLPVWFIVNFSGILINVMAR